MKLKLLILITFALMTGNVLPNALVHITPSLKEQAFIHDEVSRLMKKGKIPGLTLVLVRDGEYKVFTYGYQDMERKKKVSSSTLFQLGSCSKAFTALAVLKLIRDRQINYDTRVSSILPWMRPTFENKKKEITVEQLLHHTSGISWKSIAEIPQSNAPDALVKTIKKISDIKLSHEPGKQYEYATINYDILALIVQHIVGRPFEDYLQKEILDVLGMQHTTIGKPDSLDALACGYKIGFFRPQLYNAPVYKGNNAAGYVISNGEDMGKWVLFQLGFSHSPFSDLAQRSQQPDYSVSPEHDEFYGMGWQIPLNGRKEVRHSGLNPNFSAFVGFEKTKKVGVVVLANSNSGYTDLIGQQVLDLMEGQANVTNFKPDDKGDAIYSVFCLIFALYILTLVGYSVYCVFGIFNRRFQYAGFSIKSIIRIVRLIIILIPFLTAIYFLPFALVSFSWEAMLVWNPLSFNWLVVLLYVSIAASLLLYILNLLFVEKNRYKRMFPSVALMSVLSGLSNMSIIVAINASLSDNIEIKYIICYYMLMALFYLGSRRYVQQNMIVCTNDLIYDVRRKLMATLLTTSFRRLEQVDRGRILATTNDDVISVGQSANLLINLFTSLFSSIAAFLYLSSVAFWPALFTAAVIIIIAATYNIVVRTTRPYFEKVRDVQNSFMSLVSGLVDGFKELSLHQHKRLEYQKDIDNGSSALKNASKRAELSFVRAFLVGESSMILLLGFTAFAVPRLFTQMNDFVVANFIIVFLYLIGPVNAVLSSVPAIVRLRISWNRIQSFLLEIQSAENTGVMEVDVPQQIESFQVKDLCFSYQSLDGESQFNIGPISFSLKKGDVMFIVGGNGSGKTTLAKVITGLYLPDQGNILIDNQTVGGHISEYFSAVFNPSFLFEKLYIKNIEDKSSVIEYYLKQLKIHDKVSIANNQYNTIKLSTGERKRLALLQCYLEDSPIYLFDEWAADQDPGYRNFFYRVILPEMSKAGKIIITITHDDHYFDAAHYVVKMNNGVLEPYSPVHPSVNLESTT